MTTPTQDRLADWCEYRRIQVAELRPYVDGELLSARVSISSADRDAGSPKTGDMIARNPKNHEDQWLVAADYFAENFSAHDAEKAGPMVTDGCALIAAERGRQIEQEGWSPEHDDEHVNQLGASMRRSLTATALIAALISLGGAGAPPSPSRSERRERRERNAPERLAAAQTKRELNAARRKGRA